jgi:hypothetical protein
MIKSRRMRYGGGACSTNGEREIYIGYWWGRPKERDHWEKIGLDGMDWINLSQSRDLWRALVNTVINLRVA